MSDADDLSTVPIRDVEYYSVNSTVDMWLFQGSPQTTAFGVALPIISAFGVLLNILTFCVYQHPDMRGLSTMFLNANLLTDAAFLIFATLCIAPKMWIHKVYVEGHYQDFWKHLSGIQSMYLACHPLSLITKIMSQWYTMALIFEQYVAFTRPGALTKWSSSDQAMKIIVFIMNLTVIFHIISFFKYIKSKVFILQYPLGATHNVTVTPTKYLAEELCLSVIYRSKNYQNYEKYIYFICFEMIPWFICFFCLIVSTFAYFRLKREIRTVDAFPDVKLLRTFKSGRSVRTVLCITTVFLCLQIVAHSMYILALPGIEFDILSSGCSLSPSDRRFLQVPSYLGQVYIFVNVVNCSIKPWVCISSSYDVRYLIYSCWAWHKNLFDRISGRVYTIKRDLHKGPSASPAAQSNQKDSELPVEVDPEAIELQSEASTSYYDAISRSTHDTPMLDDDGDWSDYEMRDALPYDKDRSESMDYEMRDPVPYYKDHSESMDYEMRDAVPYYKDCSESMDYEMRDAVPYYKDHSESVDYEMRDRLPY